MQSEDQRVQLERTISLPIQGPSHLFSSLMFHSAHLFTLVQPLFNTRSSTPSAKDPSPIPIRNHVLKCPHQSRTSSTIQPNNATPTQHLQGKPIKPSQTLYTQQEPRTPFQTQPNPCSKPHETPLSKKACHVTQPSTVHATAAFLSPRKQSAPESHDARRVHNRR